MKRLSEKLRAYGLHDGHSSDTHVMVCETMHKSADMLDQYLAVIKEVQQQCLFDDDDGRIGVSEDIVIPSDMFDRICAAINKAEGRE